MWRLHLSLYKKQNSALTEKEGWRWQYLNFFTDLKLVFWLQVLDFKHHLLYLLDLIRYIAIFHGNSFSQALWFKYGKRKRMLASWVRSQQQASLWSSLLRGTWTRSVTGKTGEYTMQWSLLILVVSEATSLPPFSSLPSLQRILTSVSPTNSPPF